MAGKSKEEKGPTAAEIGRIGGGNSRIYLTPEKRKELAQRAANARWHPEEAKQAGGVKRKVGKKKAGTD